MQEVGESILSLTGNLLAGQHVRPLTGQSQGAAARAACSTVPAWTALKTVPKMPSSANSSAFDTSPAR